MKQICYSRSLVSQLFLFLLMSLTLNSCDLFGSGSPRGPRKQVRSAAASDAKKIIVILNGLWQNSETYNVTILNLVAAFEAEGLMVEVRSLVEVATSKKTIDQQAREAFEELKQQLAGDKYEIILVGHSQGGLRGSRILTLNKREGSPLDIRGLVTLGTPWEGAPGAAITKSSIQSFLNKKPVTYLFEGVNHVHPIDEAFSINAISNVFDRYFPTHDPGVRDMVPKSEFLQTTAASLFNNDIPILSVAGVNAEAKSFFYYDAGNANYMRYIQKIPPIVFNSLYARILAGGWYSKHDMLVPLDSQLAKNISKSNTFETYTVKGAIHDLLPGMKIPPDKVIYNHIETIRCIVEFTKHNCAFGVI